MELWDESFRGCYSIGLAAAAVLGLLEALTAIAPEFRIVTVINTANIE